MRWPLLTLALAARLSAVNFEWTATGGGEWTDASNWSQLSFPNAGNADVRFLGSITAPSAVNIDGSFTTRDFFFANSFSYTLSGGSLLSIDDLSVSLGSHTINADLVKGGGSTINVSSGAALTINGALSGAGVVTKTNAGTLTFGGASANTFPSTMRINGGLVIFDKTPGSHAISGNLVLNSATLRFDADDQIASTSVVTIDDTPSVFNLNGTTQTMNRLDFENGVFIGGGGTINLTRDGNSAALIIEGTTLGDAQINLIGNTTLGVDHNGNIPSTLWADLDLGTTDRRITAGGNQQVDLTLSGKITGAAGISRSGGGVRISGAQSNTFSGISTFTGGSTRLNKSGGATAIPGDIAHSGGSVILEAPNQISDSATYTLSGGTLNMNLHAETLARLNFTGGTLVDNSSLTLTSTDVALLIENETIGGWLNLTGATGGKVIRSAVGNGTAVLSSIDLGSAIREFAIENGSGSDDMAVSGEITGSGGITKTGAGRLDLRGSQSNSYTGLTTVESGSLQLSKTGGAVAIAGDLVVSGGHVEYASPAQLSLTSNVTVSGGTLEFDGVAETLGSLIFNGGSLVNNAGLTLTSTGVALQIGTVSISEPISLTGSFGGGVVFDATGGGKATLGDLDLGPAARHFIIADGPEQTDVEVTGEISGAGGIEKWGSGQLELLGAVSNSYTGQTLVAQGALVLNKDPLASAIVGPVTIAGGTLVNKQPEQIDEGQSVTQTAGVWNLWGNDETIASYTFEGGTLIQGGGRLSLCGPGTVLSMKDVAIGQTLSLTTPTETTVTTSSSASLSSSIGLVELGSADRTFDVGDGASAVDLIVFGGSTSGGGLIKEGSGLMRLEGTHAYSGTFTEVKGGTLQVAGVVTVDAISVAPGAILSGSGSIVGNVSSDGILRAGEGITTLTLIGDQVLGGSVEVTLSPSATDLIDVVGSMTINPGAILDVTALDGTYRAAQRFVIAHTTEGVTGTFAELIDESFLLLDFRTLYTPLDVLLEVVPLPFSTVKPRGNAGAVAKMLDAFDVPIGSDLELLESQIRELGSEGAIIDALDQLQPANLRGLSLAVEEGAFRLRAAAGRRLKDPCRFDLDQWSIWLFETGSLAKQGHVADLKGFDVTSGQLAVGSDFTGDRGTVGLSLTYSYNHLGLDGRRGKADLHAIGGLAYGALEQEGFFLRGYLLGGYNHYSCKRQIRFGSIHRDPRASFDGGDFLASLQLGRQWSTCRWDVSPYMLFDYHYLVQGGFEEKGGGSANNCVKGIHDEMIRAMVGVHLYSCVSFYKWTLGIELDLAYGREERFGNGIYTCQLEGAPVAYHVKGARPNHNLFIPECSLSATDPCQRYRVRAGYRGDLGNRYWDHQIFAELAVQF